MRPLRGSSTRTAWPRALAGMTLGLLVAGGCSEASPPSEGTIGVSFPSTAAAVATDYLQFFVFDGPSSEAERATLCQGLIQARRKGDALSPTAQSEPISICDAVEGRVPVTIPYGERAVLVIGTRQQKDFLIGCALQTFGAGDAALPIALSLIDPSTSLPSKTCPTVADACSGACKPN